MQLKTGKKIGGISDSVMRIFMEYPWPGNVRELRSAFEYAFVSCHDPVIQPRHLPPRLWQERRFRTMEGETSQDRAGRKKAELMDALKRAGGNRSEAAGKVEASAKEDRHCVPTEVGTRSSVFARLEFGAFYFAISSMTFYGCDPLILFRDD
jgi:transcriptional regulator with PAS, ATPase and Fis domain